MFDDVASVMGANAGSSAVLARWADQICAAAQAQQNLQIHGGRSKQFLCAPAVAPAALLDTREHNGIVAYEPSELVLTAKAGTPLHEVQAALAEQHQYLAFEPPSFGAQATLGGAIAAGLSGPARASVGAVRDFVLGVQMLNGRGEHLSFGGQVMKNVAGYDISRLLVGSMGALGVLTQVSLKVLPLAPAEATLRFACSQAEALQQLAHWRGQPLPLNASRWEPHPNAPGGTLLVRWRGAVAAVEAACQRWLANGAGERLDNAQAQADWRACSEQQLAFFQTSPDAAHGLWRLSVAPNTAAEDALGPTLLEWHGGLRWVWAPLAAAPRLKNWAQAAGGHALCFRLPQTTPAYPERWAARTAALAAIEQQLKQAFDPNGVFCPVEAATR